MRTFARRLEKVTTVLTAEERAVVLSAEASVEPGLT